VGEETNYSDGDEKCVFPLEQKKIAELKYYMGGEMYDDLSPSVGSGWKLW
jgi:hypothetical protein